MKREIYTLAAADFPVVNELMKRNSSTLGFLPGQALKESLEDGRVLGAKDDKKSLIAYLLYASYPDYIRLVHLCVDDKYRRQRVAQRLFDALKRSADTQHEIRLNCRNDYPARHLWNALGFVPIDEKPGRAARGTTLTIWQYQLKEPAQRDLFVATVRAATEVVIDAQILFHLGSPPNNTEPAHQLASDSLAETIDLCVTDEHFREIERNSNSEERKRSRRLAHSMRRLSCDRVNAERHVKTLESILPTRTKAERSDINHIALTAASEASIFVTQDERLLKQASVIEDLTGVMIRHPTALIISLYKSANPDEYVQSRVSGLDLDWQRLSASDVSNVVVQLASPNEKHGKIRQVLNSLLSDPQRYIAQKLQSPNGIQAVRITERQGRLLRVNWVRVAPSGSRALYADFIVQDTIAYAVRCGTPLIMFESHALAAELKSACMKAGFLKAADGVLTRFCLAKSVGRCALHNLVDELSPPLDHDIASMSLVELATHCTPVNVIDDGVGRYLVPIKPKFARQLFDVGGADQDLFGYSKLPLMRWENVYYRARTHHKILQAPGWILWYVSGGRKAIIGVSRLDAVECGLPKDMLKKFKKFGVLDWKDLSALCDNDPSREIMCLKFSHTCRFSSDVLLSKLRVFEHRGNVPLQSPRKINADLFTKIFNAGFTGA